MAALAANNPTLADVKKALDPNGNVMPLVEILEETNEILQDLTYMEGNLPTGNRTAIRTGYPEPTWRKLYGGVQPAKSTRKQVTDTCGMLEAYAEIDKALADLNNNTAEFRLQESIGHIQGMNNTVAETIFYGDEAVYPERFTGLAPRFSSLSAESGDNIIDAGGSGADNRSIWIVCWSPLTCFAMYPKGSQAGLQRSDKGQVTIEDVDGSGGRMEAYREHFRWDIGLCVRDWRYVVRIANIDYSLLMANSGLYTPGTGFANSCPDLTDLIHTGLDLIPNMNMGRCAMYMSRDVRTALRKQVSAKTVESSLQTTNVGGTMQTTFYEIPLRRVDALAVDEARVV